MYLLVGLSLLATAKAMSLCDYYQQLGIMKPECGHTPAPIIVPRSAPVLPLFESLPLCKHYFHSCMSSSRCESGTVCSNGAGAGSCCTDPSKSRCPSVTTLNINCRKTRGVNWCNSDMECRGASTIASMCCPTGCNYNMCIHVGISQPTSYLNRMICPTTNTTKNSYTAFSSRAMSDDVCPDPYTLNVKCLAVRTTSWCHSDYECPHNSLHRRKCCPTLCGYNTCVIKYNGLWQIA